LAQGTPLTSKFHVLADYADENFERLFSLLEWLEANPSSDLYLRQLPVRGLDTKWIEQRAGVVAGLFRAIRGLPAGDDFYELCGLKRPPHRVRVRVLCPVLRNAMGGLRDIESPVEELARLPIAPAACIVVENLETGLAMPDLPGTVCIMKLGNAVSVLGALAWLQPSKAFYWGDIDTHGFAILDRARQALPRLRSVLMDEATLGTHRELCGQEPTQCADGALPNLQESERAVYAGLRENRWGVRLRLEQERVSWDYAIGAINSAMKT
jgi:Uncharacterized protein conserved in bacteria